VDMDECVAIARSVGRRIGEELGIPVYLYEQAASKPGRRNLADVRAGEYEGLAEKLALAEWQPDFGPATFNARSGATAVGAREFLIAYNINPNTSDRRYANEIAYELRERGRWKRAGNTEPFYYKGEVVYFEEGKYPDGNSDFVGESFEQLAKHYRETRGGDLRKRYRSIGLDPDNLIGRPVYKDGMFTHVKGIGWVVEAYQRAQVSLNLTNYKITAPQEVLEAARELAAARGMVVTGSEIVGVVPFDAMRRAGRFYLQRMRKSTGVPARDLLTAAAQAMGLDDVAEFDVDRKVIGMPRQDGPLVSKTVSEFDRRVGRRPGRGAGVDGRQPVDRQGGVRRALRGIVRPGRAGAGCQGRTGSGGRRRYRGLQRGHRRLTHAKRHGQADRTARRGDPGRLQIGCGSTPANGSDLP